jgi:hypothetical protein
MSYARWAGDNGPWYAWGGDGPVFNADGTYTYPSVDGPLVLALWHNREDDGRYIDRHDLTHEEEEREHYP